MIGGENMESVVTVKDGRNVVWYSKNDLKGKTVVLGKQFDNIWKAFDYGIADRKDDERLVLNWMLYVLWQRVGNDITFWSLVRRPGNKILVFSDGEGEFGCKNEEMDAARRQIRKDVYAKYGDDLDEDGRKARKAELDWELTNLVCGTWTGKNKFGKLLKICGECVRRKNTPYIDYEYLDKVGIDWFGTRIKFTKKTVKRTESAA